MARRSHIKQDNHERIITQEEMIEPKTRPDRSEKCQGRKESEETVVKCCLVTRIAVKEKRHAVLDAVQARIEAYSKRVHREGCNNVDFAKDTGQEDYG